MARNLCLAETQSESPDDRLPGAVSSGDIEASLRSNGVHSAEHRDGMGFWRGTARRHAREVNAPAAQFDGEQDIHRDETVSTPHFDGREVDRGLLVTIDPARECREE